MIVRSSLPWPVRWLLAGAVLGLSAAVALWAFEFGREIAGLDRTTQEQAELLRTENARLRETLDRVQSVANTAESLLTAERATQQRLVEQLKSSEEANRLLRRDLGFFEELMPANGEQSVAVRGLRARRMAPDKVAWQLVLVQPARQVSDSKVEIDLVLSGTLDGKPWELRDPGLRRTVALKQYLRLVGEVAVSPGAVVQSASVRLHQAGSAPKTETVAVTAESQHDR